MGAKPFAACSIWDTKPASSVPKRTWIGWDKSDEQWVTGGKFRQLFFAHHSLLAADHARHNTPSCSQRRPESPHRRRRHAVGEQRLLRARHRPLHLFLEPSRVLRGTGS